MTDQSNDGHQKSPVDAAIETFVYAPIGLLFEGSSLLPQLIEKGRNQVSMARMLGQFAIKQASGEAAKAAGKLQDQAAGVLEFIGGSVTPLPPEPGPAPQAKPARPTPSARKGGSPARAAARKVAGVGAGAGAAARPGSAPKSGSAPRTNASAGDGATATAPADDGSLGIPDYDGLSASHVVNRLAGLAPDELEAVRRYELAHRGRKTILSKVAQLQSS